MSSQPCCAHWKMRGAQGRCRDGSGFFFSEVLSSVSIRKNRKLKERRAIEFNFIHRCSGGYRGHASPTPIERARLKVTLCHSCLLQVSFPPLLLTQDFSGQYSAECTNQSGERGSRDGQATTWIVRVGYMVAKTQRFPYLVRSFSAKVTYI